MRLPRDLSGAALIRALESLGYQTTRATGSHARLTCSSPNQHHVTIPLHDTLRVGTLAAILADVRQAQGIERDELMNRLFKR